MYLVFCYSFKSVCYACTVVGARFNEAVVKFQQCIKNHFSYHILIWYLIVER